MNDMPSTEMLEDFLARANAFQKKMDEQGYGDPAKAELKLLRRLYDFISNELNIGDPDDGGADAHVPWADLNDIDEITDLIEAHYGKYGWPSELMDVQKRREAADELTKLNRDMGLY